MPSADLSMSADTYLADDIPTTNHGTETSFYVGEWNGGAQNSRSLLKPDFSPVPSGKIITAAILKITPTDDWTSNARTLRIYRSLRDWVETQATWNIWKTSNNWNTGGSGGSGSDYDSTELGNVSVSASPTIGTAIEITLTASEVQKLYDGTYTNNGFFLKVDTENADMIGYASKEHATSGYRPILSVTYSDAPQANFFPFF